MKKFFFSLNTVLNYKEQVLDSLRGEHAKILLQIRQCEEDIERLEKQYRDCVADYERDKRRGMSISDMKSYEFYLERLGVQMLQKQERLAGLKKREEEKRNQVIEAKKEAASINKLKEKKQQEYYRQEQKEQELLIEEFVSTKNAMAKLNG